MNRILTNFISANIFVLKLFFHTVDINQSSLGICDKIMVGMQPSCQINKNLLQELRFTVGNRLYVSLNFYKTFNNIGEREETTF